MDVSKHKLERLNGPPTEVGCYWFRGELWGMQRNEVCRVYEDSHGLSAHFTVEDPYEDSNPDSYPMVYVSCVQGGTWWRIPEPEGGDNVR